MRRLDGAHFIGVGGVGMSAIAQVLVARGLRISGSDARESDFTRRLREGGAAIFIGHAAQNVAAASIVVVSSAIKEDNPELRAARQLNVPVWHRSQALAAVMDQGRSIGVAGAHGKTTTTLMTGYVLTAAGLDPTVLVGGWVDDYGGGARVGAAEVAGAANNWVVAEVDESDGSFLNIRPSLSIVTNIDFDHPDHFKDLAHVRREFVAYLNQTREGGAAIVDGDDAGVRGALPLVKPKVIRCGLEDPASDFYGCVTHLSSDESRFEARREGRSLGEATLRVGGIHNVRNALLAIAAGFEAGAQFEQCRAGLESFRAVRRRFEFKGQASGARVYDDYAHHPQEIIATLAVAARIREEQGGRVIAIFQPHRYSRTQAFAEKFGHAFAQADKVIITGVYSAGEAPIEGVSGALIANAAKRAGHPDVAYCPRLEEVADAVLPGLRTGDVVLTLGAGDVTNLGPVLVARLREKEGPQ